jgi:hypothetical protein
MPHARSLRRLLLGALLAGTAVIAVPAAANAASTCSYNASTRTATINDGSGVFPLMISRNGQAIVFRDQPSIDVVCQGATVTNTDLIFVNGTASAADGTASATIREGYVIDLSRGALGPGATPETDGNSEVEIKIRQQVANPARLLDIFGTTQADTIRVGGGNTPGVSSPGVMFGNDADLDMNIFRADGSAQRVKSIEVDGNLGDDFITGRGGFGVNSFFPAATVPPLIRGRAGNDTLVDGLAGDRLEGDFGNEVPRPGAEMGNDTLFSVDGVRDSLVGSLGFDTATTDAVDDVSTVEQRTIGSVGRLRLEPAAVRARVGDVARMRMSWTHPKDWHRVRSIEMRLVRGSDTVGRVVVKPATDKVRAHGKLALAAGTQVSHNGKTVTAKLAVRLPKSLAGEHLRLDVQATDRRGRTQLAPAAGAITLR